MLNSDDIQKKLDDEFMENFNSLPLERQAFYRTEIRKSLNKARAEVGLPALPTI